jgi:hypothetical protein
MRRYLIAASALLITTLACAGLPSAETGGSALEEAGLGPTPTPTLTPTPTPLAGAALGEGGASAEEPPAPSGEGTNPFEEPPPDMENFPPLPADLPPDAGEYGTPREGLWTVLNHTGSVSCPGAIEVDIPESPPEQGTITVIEPDQSFLASGLGSMEEGQTADITFTANPPVQGRYIGTVDISQEGVTVTIVYHLIVGWPEYMLGYLESDYEFQDIECHVERPYELFYAGGEEGEG